MNAVVTMKFLIRDVCEPSSFGPGEPFANLEDLVKDLIAQEGIAGLAEDDGEVVSIRETK
jgi:hypothetical protein